MNNEQMNAAKEQMISWLSHPSELGKEPSKIECAGSFELYDMTYYIFKYKKSMFGKWLLGVAGGYEGDSLENCGHTFSEMEEYNEATAKDDAVKMVEMIRKYWMDMAERAQEHENEKGTFAGFVLLSDNKWDKEKYINDLKEMWDIEAVEEDEKRDDSLVFSIDDKILAVSLMSAPVPNGEAVENAKNNYMWQDAVKAAEEHKAHLMVAVVDKNKDNVIENGKYYTKLLASACRQEAATGVYTSGVVFEPAFYEQVSYIMKDDALPIYNWIWFGLYKSQNGVSGYTYGMNIFGKDEMEVLDADASPAEVRDFLFSMASYVLMYDVTLNDGETIGFSETDKHKITRSQGIALPEQMTLKIEY